MNVDANKLVDMTSILEQEKEPSISGHYLQLAQMLAQHFSKPFAPAAVERTLPGDFEKRGRTIVPRVLGTVGLKSEFVLRDLREIDAVVLPWVLFRNGGDPILVHNFSNARKNVVVTDFSAGGFSQEIAVRKLRRQVGRNVLLVTDSADVTTSRTEPGQMDGKGQTGHWLWKPMRENGGAFFQILLAAFGINVFGLALPIFVMNVYDRVIPNLAMVTLWTLAAGVAIALVLDLVLKLVRTNVLEVTGRRVDMKIASTLFQHAMNIRLIHRQGGAAGIASQIRDFEMVREFFTSSSFVAVIDLLFIGIFVAVLWVIVGPIAIVPLIAVPIVIGLALIAQLPIGSAIHKAQELAAKRHLVLIESLLGVETVKSVNGERVMQQEWENAVAASARISAKTRFWSNFAISGTMLIQQAVSVLMIVWGVYLVAEGRISIGGLIAANILAGRMLAPLGNITQTLVRAQHAFKALGSISQFMKLPVEAGDNVRSGLAVADAAIAFKDVSVTYPGSKVAALSEVCLEIKPGETLGVLGRVGSGKTTLGKMFAGLLQPDSGIILVDGHEMQQYEPAVLREGIGYLPQDPELFTGTIRENLLLGHPHASEDELNRALYLAGMDHFIAENPQGLNQFVGEKGNRLSGGQRQAISLARLLLRRPKLLFLDEPTNAMDNGTEAIVIARMKRLRDEGVSLVVATHRNSLAAVVDRLIVLDKGKKIADGPREDIMQQLARNTAARAAEGAA